MDTTPLTPVPSNLADGRGRLLHGLWAGRVADDPVRTVRQRGGRVRRWSYAAAGDDQLSLGAAVVDVGIGATAFAWAVVDGRTCTWERTVVGGRGITVPDRSSGRGSATVDDATLVVGPRGDLRIDVPTPEGRLRADLRTEPDGVPAVCATPTPRGGWNVTEKHAGYPAAGRVEIGRRSREVDGAGWSDWTAGRQDRRTAWRWAAGAGRSEGGRRVGLNVSTGMNGAGPGEDVVWWDGVPHALTVERLEPRRAPDGPWRVAGPGWALAFETGAVRAADENLVVLRSRYVQPIGRFVGTLPTPDGPVEVELVGVTEDHLARW